MKKILIYTLLSMFSTSLFSQGYKIEVTVAGAPNDTLLMAFYYGHVEMRYAKDTAYTDNKGYAVFSKTTPLPGGMYLLAKKGVVLFDFLISDDDSQQFAIYVEDNNIMESLKFTNSPENEKYLETQRYMGERQRRSMRLREKVYADKNYEAIAQDSLNITAQEVQSYVEEVVRQFPGKLIASLVTAMKGSPPVPEIDIPEDTPARDTILGEHSYQFNKNHYFDNINFSDKRLLHTPVLQPNLDYYFTNILLQVPDSIIPQVEMVLERAKADKDIFMYCTSHVCNTFIDSPIMGMESVVVFIAKKYYLSGQAYWATEELLKQMTDFVAYNQFSLIGMQAHELKMQNLKGEEVSLYGLQAPYIVVFFYEPNCNHCQKEAPKLLEVYHKYKDSDVKFMAINIQINYEEWINFVENGNYDWINVWYPPRKSQFPDFYNVATTPQVYLLDKDKKIIARRIESQNLDLILKNILNK